MQLKPRKQAIIMVHVLARHLLHLQSLVEFILANRALVMLRVQQLIIDGHRREILNGILRRRRGTVTIRIVLGELLNQLLKAGTEEVISDICRKAKPWLRRMVDFELNIGSVGAKALEVVLEEQKRIEHLGFGEIGVGPGTRGIGEDARVLEVDGGGGGGGG